MAILANSSMVEISLSAPRLVILPEPVGGLGQPQRGLRRAHRGRVAAAVGIDHQQMDRVATHVQHAQSHENKLAGRRYGRVATRARRPVACAGRAGLWRNPAAGFVV
ncbi:hypothetical protein I917_03565 [Mycobacterium tuberculosis str. Haarlem/NITR202]|uniref:Uncharacterized protein n=1 Tax=Mycobacterium tuberculosis str. Haarlem/NITR202 TaxID=1304279 RepID=R4LZ64_MYCTX|nr:hypothetical protein I917_03565 [Mycobacterium tuberculosis str. Haarlem/NITR202]